jgi:hypothetical protein
VNRTALFPAFLAAILLAPVLLPGAPLKANEAWVILNGAGLWQDQAGGGLKSIEILSLGDKVALLNKTSKFRQDGKDQDFLRVRASDNREGWVRSQYVTPQAGLAVVLADKAAVFSGPSGGKTTGKYISNMTVVAVVLKESTGDFASVRCFDVSQNAFFGDSTYVAMKDLALASEDVGAVVTYWIAAGTRDLAQRRTLLKGIVANDSTSEFLPQILVALGAISKPTAKASGTYSVNADKVNVRVSPDEKNGQVIGQVNQYDPVDVLEKTVDSYTINNQTAPWYRIKDPAGWVFGAFIDPFK